MMKIKDYYDKVLAQYRCSNCNRLLFKGKIRGDFRVETLCPRCKKLNIIERKIIEKDVNLTNKDN